MRQIIVKILHQSRYDGFIRFIDGNRMNYCRKNIEPVPFCYAIKSIGTKDITDWDACLTKDERDKILKNKQEFDHEVKKYMLSNYIPSSDECNTNKKDNHDMFLL